MSVGWLRYILKECVSPLRSRSGQWTRTGIDILEFIAFYFKTLHNLLIFKDHLTIWKWHFIVLFVPKYRQIFISQLDQKLEEAISLLFKLKHPALYTVVKFLSNYLNGSLVDSVGADKNSQYTWGVVAITLTKLTFLGISKKELLATRLIWGWNYVWCSRSAIFYISLLSATEMLERKKVMVGLYKHLGCARTSVLITIQGTM